ncbi:MAG: phosphatidate cytidylyltransferase, partial [Bacillota bacterium]
SAIFGLLSLFFVVNWGSIPFLFVNILLIILGINEFILFIQKKYRCNNLIFYFLAVIFSLYVYFINNNILPLSLGFIFLFIILFLFIYFILVKGFENILISISINLMGIIYISGGLTFLILLKDMEVSFLGYTWPLWLVLIATWVTDTGAYFSGRFFGKNKLAPKVSPNKTIEGAIGGIFFSFLVIIFIFWINNGLSLSLITYAILLPVVAIIGDLFESALKRDAGIKDSGNIFPGHGGVLDRFDSIIFTSSFTYFYFIIIELI